MATSTAAECFNTKGLVLTHEYAILSVKSQSRIELTRAVERLARIKCISS